MTAKPNPPAGYTTLDGIAELLNISRSGLKKLLVGKETN
jgi:hypothetical protein